MDIITEYFNYIIESLNIFHQHRSTISNLYNNVIEKQQEAIEQFQLNNTKSKGKIIQIQNRILIPCL